MAKRYREWSPDQSFLLPPSPRDWLSEDHLVYFLLELGDELDLSAIERAIQQKDSRGNRPFDPRLMTVLLLYGYCIGVASSRKLEQACQTDVAFRVLCAGHHPDHSAIAEFRRQHLQALRGLFLQVLRLCQAAGLVKLGHVALDGTKVAANASKHKAMSYERMLKKEAELSEEIDRLLQQAERTDQEEDARHGRGRRGDELPEELRRREGRRAKIRRARQALEAEAARARAAAEAARAKEAQAQAEQAEAAKAEQAKRRAEQALQRAAEAAEKAAEKAKERLEQAEAEARAAAEQTATAAERRRASAAQQRRDDAEQALQALLHREPPPAGPQWPEHQVPTTASGDPTATAQRNFTDEASRIMKAGTGYVQAYNCQLAVDEGHQIIVAEGVTNQAPDTQHLPVLLDAVIANCEHVPEKATADAGYFSLENASYCEAHGIDGYLAPGRQKHEQPAPPEAALAAPTPNDAAARMRQKLQTAPGRAAYARRKAVVEPAFGQIKEARGFRRFLLRGLEQVRGEWALICTGHNLRKLFSARTRLAAASTS